MRYSVEVEKPSSIVRKFTIKVPAEEVKSKFDSGLVEVQKTASLKGFRPGQAPISIIKQYYGDDIRHRIFHNLIDESFEIAVRDQNVKAIGRPQIDTPEHKHGEGDHDHGLHEDQDLTYIATFEVMPELEVKDYEGLSLTQDKVAVTSEQIEKVVENLHQSQAQLVPVSGGLTLADGTQSSRPVQTGDFVDTQVEGGLVTESGVESRPEMKGNRLIEIGSASFMPGFEDQLVGMRRGESKTFRLTFPTEYSEKELVGKEAEFTVTVNEVKEKKLPPMDEEFAKQMGYEGLEDLRKKASEFLNRERTAESDRKLRSDLLAKLIEKNPFEVPATLIDAQTRSLAQDWAQELKKEGYQEKVIQDVLTQELDSIKKRAEGQVRASLILQSIADSENIKVSEEEVSKEVENLSTAMNVDLTKLQEYYAKNPGRMDDLEFRLRQERTVKFLLEKSKIKSVEAKDQ